MRPRTGLSRPRGVFAAAAVLLVGAGCVLDDLTGPDEVFSELGVGGDSIMFVGASQDLSVNLVERTARGPSRVLWSSSDSTVFWVENGVVTALGEGSGTVTARLTGPDLSQPIQQTVELRSEYSAIAMQQIDSLTGIGETRAALVYGLNVDSTFHEPVISTFESSDTTVFTVDSEGMIESTGPGEATLTASRDALSTEAIVRVRQVAGEVFFPTTDLTLTTLGRDTTIAFGANDTQGHPIETIESTWEPSDSTVVVIVAPGIIRPLEARSATVTVTIDTIVTVLTTRVEQVAGSVTAVSGNGQSATVGTTLATPIQIEVLDAGGLPIDGDTVRFEVSAGGGSLSTTEAVTDSTGIAELASGWTLGTTAGEQALTVTTSGLTGEVTATALPGPVSPVTSSVSVVRDTVVIGAQTPITLTAQDQYGNALISGGDAVAFSTSGGTSDGTISPVVDEANGTYSAAFTGTVIGTPITLSATVNGVTISTPLPQLVVIPGETAASLTVSSGDSQTATAGSAVSAPLRVIARDAGANAVRNVVVVFSVTSGGGTLSDSIVSTDDNGIAELGSWTLGTTSGTNTLSAVSGALSVGFSATGTPGLGDAATSEVAASATSLTAGDSITLTVTTRDEFGNLTTAGGQVVDFVASGGSSGGTFGPTTDQGNGSYTATFHGTTAGTPTTISTTLDGNTVGATVDVSVVPGPAAQLLPGSGEAQTATVGTAVSVAPEVEVRDAFDNPVAGQTVAFTIQSGGGSVSGAAPSTGVDGRAAVGAWTLGTTSGENTLRATVGAMTFDFTATASAGAADADNSLISVSQDIVVAGEEITMTLTGYDVYGNPTTAGGQTIAFSLSGGTSNGTFGATTDAGDGSYTAPFTGTDAGTPSDVGATIDGNAVTTAMPSIIVVPSGTASTLELNAGDAQTAFAGTGVSVAPSVIARDGSLNPVENVVVAYTITAGAGVLIDSIVATDSTGVAELGGWILDQVPGANAIRATAGSLVVDFTADGTVGPGSPITSVLDVPVDTLVAGDTIDFSVEVLDAFGNPVGVGGQSVLFSAEGGTSAGQFGTVVDETDGTYTVEFVPETAGSPTFIRATLDGDTLVDAHPLVILPGLPAILSPGLGSEQIVEVGLTLPTPPSVVLTDPFGNAIADQTVGFAVLTGGGAVTGPVTTTDVNGEATVGSWTLGTLPGPNTLRATAGPLTADISATGLTGSASPVESVIQLSGTSITAGDSITVTLLSNDQYGNPLTTGGSTVTFGLGGGTSDGIFGTVTDVGDGSYTATLVGQIAGTASTVTAVLNGDSVSSPPPLLTILPGLPANLVPSVGDGQIVDVGLTLPTRPSVVLTDPFGNPVPGQTVGFSVTNGGGSITGPVTTTDAAGEATVGSWTLGTIPGANTLQASAGPLTADISATALTGSASPVQSAIQLSGTSVEAGDSVTVTLLANDEYGNPLSAGGSTVSFGLGGGSSDGVFGPVTDVGDGSYVAMLTGQIAGTGATLTALLDGDSVSSTPPVLTVVPGVVDTLVAIAGSGLSATVNAALAQAPRVRAEDAFGNRVSGEVITFGVDAGGGSVTGASVSTDGDGEAEVGSWILGTTAGENRLLATAVGVSTEFLATGLPGASSAAESLISSSGSTVLVAELVTITLTVRDEFGNPIDTGGQAVTFSPSGGIGVSVGTIGSVVDNGDGTYSATFLGVTVGTPTTISATLDGEAIGDTVLIEVTLPL